MEDTEEQREKNCKYSEQTHHNNHAMFTITMDLNHRSSNFVLACCCYPGFADCSEVILGMATYCIIFTF